MSHSPSTQDDPIVSAAVDVLAEFGPTRMTMADVARRAGVSRMTVYRRYRSLDAVISAALTAEIADVVADAMHTPSSGEAARDRIVAQSVAVISALVDHTLLQRVLEVDPQSVLPLLVERIGSGQRLLQDYLAVALESGMAGRGGDGSIRDGDPRLLALCILTMAQPFVMAMRPLRQEYPQEQLLAELATAIDRYLRGD